MGGSHWTSKCWSVLTTTLTVPWALGKLTIIEAFIDEDFDCRVPANSDSQGAHARFLIDAKLPEVHEMIPESESPTDGKLGYSPIYSRAGLGCVWQ